MMNSDLTSQRKVSIQHSYSSKPRGGYERKG